MKTLVSAALAAVLVASPALADMMIKDAYARSSGPMAKAGAAFMILENMGQTDDRLISATSPVAARVELHTHMEEDGVMRMMEVEEGFPIPAGGTYTLARGGDHVMFMGIAEGWSQGDMIPVTFVFENAGEMELEIMVDLERKPMHGEGHGMKHGDHSGHGGHSNASN